MDSQESRLNTCNDGDLLTIEDLAAMLSKCKETVIRAVERGELPKPVPFFKHRVWTAGAIRRYIDKRLTDAQIELDRMRVPRKAS